MAVETVMQSGTDHPRALDNHNPPETTLKRSNPSLIHFDRDVFVKFSSVYRVFKRKEKISGKFKMERDRDEVILFEPRTISKRSRPF